MSYFKFDRNFFLSRKRLVYYVELMAICLANTKYLINTYYTCISVSYLVKQTFFSFFSIAKHIDVCLVNLIIFRGVFEDDF